ncbi:MAG: glycoside hydrolase family 2 protein, partial [Clostridia bacterium]|nr:glycoside hydrolase family 2 protein [Clostridia bacterium]
MKQNKQSDFIYAEAFEHCDKTHVRYRTKVDLNWKFLQNDTVDASAADFDDSAWRLLNLPHDWSIEGEYDQSNPSGGSGGYLPTGIGWYRKVLSIPAEWRQGRRLYLAFDGVFTNSTVYVDGVKVGNREYGWLSFVCDITHVARDKESVTVAVKVDNSVQPAARWYTGSGIYSHVWVISAGEVHVAENGTYVTTPADDRGIPTGAVTLETVVKNDSAADTVISVRSAICRKCDDQPLAWVSSDPVALPAGGEVTVHQQAQVESPALWCPDAPWLHYVKTEILSGAEVWDDYVTEFGFRAVTYDANGFYLNGESVVLKGVCNHWALGALGAAQSTNMIRYKIQFMKDMGVNCLRTSHNACPPEFYELCNEMGMMVMDEFSEGERGKTAGDYGTRWFQSLWKRDFEYWVRRDRNHPCIVVWSIGNEIGSMNDNTGISPHIKQFDLTRPTTGSMIFTGVDIPGANGISEGAKFTRPDETLPLIATEAPHTHASRGVYRTQTWYRGRFAEEGSGGIIYNLSDSEIFRYDWSSEAVGSRIWPSDFDNATSQTSVRRHWTLTRDNDWRVGEFRWTGYDYLGEANYVLGGWPYRMFHSGAVDCAIFAKDMYYLYQSMWLKTPVLHILPSWTHPTMEKGTRIPVWVYSNCEKAELFLNGKSQGVVDRGPIDTRDQHSIQFDWLVPYEEGTLTAVGYDRD